jgi:tRNA(fMet)-specific endonuclease VapC
VSYLLDTNAVIALMEVRQPLFNRVRRRAPANFHLSAIVTHELYFGAYNGRGTNETLDRLDGLRFEILDFDLEDARRSAEIRAVLARNGTPIGPYDVLIAGQALNRGLTLITRNTREFSRVEGLAVEDWEGA